MRPLTLLAIPIVTVLGCSPPAAVTECVTASSGASEGRAPSCIALVAAADLAATGSVALHRVRTSPFTVSVDAAGHQLFELDITLAGLPDPRSFGPYATYVAWAVTPDLAHEVRLGEMHNGRNAGGIVGLNQFIVMITAEPTATGSTHSGKAVLNGTSPSWALQPHDALPIVPGTSHPAAMRMSGHTGNALSWVMPPMHPLVPQMVPGVEALVPAAIPWLPRLAVSDASVPAMQPRQVVTVRDGDSLDLTAGLVRRTIAGRAVTTFGFNGQSPGPLIRVDQDARVVVNFTNALDQPTSIHWHGVRLDNASDGTPMTVRDAVPPRGHFRYVVHFPDAGLYWYHPHVREDTQQDLGLYGNLFVRSTTAGFFAEVDHEEVLMLDDLLLDNASALVPYGADAATHALMGRFGNLLLVNGVHDYALRVDQGDVVRFLLTNASSTRVFNLSFPGARIKLVGGDNGLMEREVWVSSVVIGPAERYIVEARFDSTGRVALLNHVQGVDRYRGTFFDEVDTLGIVTVAPAASSSSAAATFGTLRANAAVTRDIDRYRSRLTAPPDYTLLLSLDSAQTLPTELWQVLRNEIWPGTPIEWTGTMPMMDWLATSHEVRWVLRDSATRRENMNIAWRFHVGDVVRLRLVNDARVLHPMQHPIHIHGQRFLVAAMDGEPMTNRVWKDTALVPAGSTVDLLVEMTNAGRWMLHCHIPEHMESGMHLMFDVVP